MFVGMVFFSKALKHPCTNKTQIMKKGYDCWYMEETRLYYIFWGYCSLHFICIKLTLSCLSDWLTDWLIVYLHRYQVTTFYLFFLTLLVFLYHFLVLVNATQFANFHTKLTVAYPSITNSIFRWKSKNQPLIRLYVRLFVIRKNEIIQPPGLIFVRTYSHSFCGKTWCQKMRAVNGYQYSVLIKNWHEITAKIHRNK